MWCRGCRPEFTRGLHEGVGFSAGITRVLFKNEFPALIGLVRGFSIWFDRAFLLTGVNTAFRKFAVGFVKTYKTT